MPRHIMRVGIKYMFCRIQRETLQGDEKPIRNSNWARNEISYTITYWL